MEHMIFDKKLTFEEIVKILQELEGEVNSMLVPS
jgi:iron only hydrogenase large subunit-like protein